MVKTLFPKVWGVPWCLLGDTFDAALPCSSHSHILPPKVPLAPRDPQAPGLREGVSPSQEDQPWSRGLPSLPSPPHCPLTPPVPLCWESLGLLPGPALELVASGAAHLEAGAGHRHQDLSDNKSFR